jgi:hypothetical protein
MSVFVSSANLAGVRKGDDMGARRIRRDLIQRDQRLSRKENGVRKVKETTRRDASMTERVKSGKLPFIPAVMSWLSRKLDKPSTKITQADVDQLVKG